MKHVNKLLRSLDLDTTGLEPLSPTTAHVDVSPSTTSSFPNTPVESSPMLPRSTDAIFQKFNDLGASVPQGHLRAFGNPQVGSQAKTSKDLYWADPSMSILHGSITNASSTNQSATCFTSSPDVLNYSQVTSFLPSHLENFSGDHRRCPSANASNNWSRPPLSDLHDWTQLSPSLDSVNGNELGPEFSFSRTVPSEANRLGTSYPTSNSSGTRHHASSQNEVSELSLRFRTLTISSPSTFFLFSILRPLLLILSSLLVL